MHAAAVDDKVSEEGREIEPTNNDDHGGNSADILVATCPDAHGGESDQLEADDGEEKEPQTHLHEQKLHDDESRNQVSPRGVLDISIIAAASSPSSSSDLDITGLSSTSSSDDSSPHASPPPATVPPPDDTSAGAAPDSRNSQLQWKAFITGLIQRRNKTAPVPTPTPAPAAIKRLSTFPPPNEPDLSPSSSRWSFSRRFLRINSRWLPAVEDVAPDRRQRDQQWKGSVPIGKWKPSWRNFDYQELLQATDNFSSEQLIGKGGHAEVYKGCLPDGQLVAVKKLTKKNNEEDRIADFLSELGIIAHVNHPNAAHLVGFGVEGGLHMVLKFSPHGSLASVLHGSAEKLNWGTRFKIALGVAEGLLYLHQGCHRRIIHRDIKASNVLLTEDYQPQISDFGLAKWLPDQWTHHVVFPIEGTFGYLAPEYFMHGVVSEKTDVFAYGVLLLELITGRKAIDSSRQSLVMWAKPLLDKRDLKGLIDPCLEGVFDLKEVTCSVSAASACIHHLSAVRPDMKKVVDLLKGENDSVATISGEPQKPVEAMGSRAAFFDGGDLEDYTCSRYLNDLHRHKQLALEQ